MIEASGRERRQNGRDFELEWQQRLPGIWQPCHLLLLYKSGSVAEPELLTHHFSGICYNFRPYLKFGLL
jgi:hypothetical protein